MAARARSRRINLVDWKRARRLYERDGKSFTEISRILGCNRNTIAAHAKAGAWIAMAEIERSSSGDRARKIYELFIERDAETIRQNLARKHALTARILRLSEKQLDQLECGAVGPDESASLMLRRIALTIQTVEVVDRSLAGLTTDGSWRPAASGGGSDSGADATAVRSALDELEIDDAAGGGEGAEGALPH